MKKILKQGGLLIVAPFQGQSDYGTRAVHYSGFDGVLWPTLNNNLFEQGLVPRDRIEDIEDIYRSLPVKNARLLIIASNYIDLQKDFDKFNFIGIDVGYFNSSYNHFSFLLNELGRESIEKQEFSLKLNGYTLFDNRETANDFLIERLASQDKKLETLSFEDNSNIFYIYRYLLDGHFNK